MKRNETKNKLAKHRDVVEVAFTLCPHCESILRFRSAPCRSNSIIIVFDLAVPCVHDHQITLESTESERERAKKIHSKSALTFTFHKK